MIFLQCAGIFVMLYWYLSSYLTYCFLQKLNQFLLVGHTLTQKLEAEYEFYSSLEYWIFLGLEILIPL